jgi:predicted metal-binding protein
MDNYQDAKKLAETSGFSHVGELDPKTIHVRVEVRDTCAENKCHNYGKNWACPPGCGTLDECQDKISKYNRGLILQTTAVMEDKFDFETMTEAAKNHGEAFRAFNEKIRELYPDSLLMGAGTCSNCKDCTYPDKPCRFPDRMTSSMEAMGMVVSDVCRDNDINYYYGENTLTYVGCVLLD